jgi:hypothetical protein
MATPATPVSVAAPPSAPAAPPPSAPAPSPAPPPAAPPSAPAATETPAVQPGATQPAAPAAPYDPKTAPKPPVATDYPNTTDGQTEYATQMNRWFREHPEGEKSAVDAPPAAEQTPEQKALAESQPPDAPKPPAAPEVAPTPQALAEMMEKNPKFKEFMESNPDVKGPVFKLARELAEVAPIREIFPSVDDAKFAQEYSSNMVGLKTASLRLTNNPESAPQFLEMFDSQFARVDGQGNPVLDAAGKPTYDPDREAVRGAIFNSEVQQFAQKFTGEIAELKTKLAGNYPSDSARKADQTRLDNLEYATSALNVLDSIRDGSFFEAGVPELPADATPEQKAWFEGEQKKLADQRKELEDKQKGASKEERAAASAKFQSAVREDMGSSAGLVIGNALEAVMKSGVYIPQALLDQPYLDDRGVEHPETKDIVVRLFRQFEKKLHTPGSRTLMEMAQHDLLPENDQTRQIRKDWYAKQAVEILGGDKGLVLKEVDRIQSLVKLDSKRQADMLTERNRVAQAEPSTGGSQLPAAASREQVLQAAEEAAKKDPGWAAANPTDRQARILTQVHRMQRK